MTEDRKSPRGHLVTVADRKAVKETRINHPFNAGRSDLYWTPLSEAVGMQRAQVSLGRVPPGRESFIYHYHTVQEEWIFILSGAGEAEIGEETFAVGPGDFMGFPTDGLGHHLRNTGKEYLVYLMGGERTAHEVAHFPRAGKAIIAGADSLYTVDSAALEPRSAAEWIAEAVVEAGGPGDDGKG